MGGFRLLIVDGYESHHSVDFKAYFYENNIITLCMPPHSSHLLQPLGVGLFGLLKRALCRKIEIFIEAHITHIGKIEFFLAFHAAHKAAFTKRDIDGGFRGAG